jgi:predicted ATPase/DNA-binding SARP family transcriptional activator
MPAHRSADRPPAQDLPAPAHDGVHAPIGAPVPELTTFIGRAAELAELERLLGDVRLLTLTGAGGSGKTRLAQELVARPGVAGRGVAWVELASLDDPALIPQRVAETFGVRDEVTGPTPLMGLLRSRSGVLVLDNCEHLVEACAELVHELLRGCPRLAVLATSREALGVRGERAWLVPPLEDGEAVRLFVDRARDLVPGFELTPATRPAVTEICRRLDGIPLAIELAAARVRVLSVDQIRQRLDDAFRLLTAGGRTAIPRHRTLRATIDWSHDLLRDESKVFFRRQAVFRDGFTLEAAEAVCAGDGIGADDILDLIARLVDRSLLTVREHRGFARYAPLETVRQYAAERLTESGEEATVRRRHAEHVFGLVAAAAAHATGPGRRAAFDALAPEMENIREALHWTHEHDGALHVRLAGRLGWFWFAVGHWAEGRRWMEGALALPDAGSRGRDRAQLLFAAGAIAALQADIAAARPWLQEAAALSAEIGADDIVAYALNYLGMTYSGQGSAEGEIHCRRAEAWFREAGDDYGLRLALLLIGMAQVFSGRAADGIRTTEEAVAVARRFGQDRELSVSLQNLALLNILVGQVAAAEPLLLEALAAARRDPSLFFIATTLDGLGEVRIRQGRVAEGGRIIGAAEGVRDLIAAPRFAVNQKRLDALFQTLAASPDGPAFETARAEGRGVSMEAILEEVLSGGSTPGRGDERTDSAEASRAPAGTVLISGSAQPAGAAPTTGSTPTADFAPSPGRSSAPSPGRSSALPPELASESATAAAADLHIAALGSLRVTVRRRPLEPDAWPFAKPKELLVLLALHPAGRTREEVGRALWPGASPSQVKNSFHVALHHLRRTLGGPEWVVIEGERYRLSPAITIELDADRFEREARAALREDGADPARLRAVLELHRGDLLEDDPVGAWVDDHRDRLRRLAVDLGLALGSALEARGDAAAAAETYHAIAVREELDEEAQRRLMRVWAAAGDRVRALRHYERLVALLRDELDADPEPETVRVGEALRRPAWEDDRSAAVPIPQQPSV